MKQSKITKIEDINCYSDACKVLAIKPDFNLDPSNKLKIIIKACNYIDNDYKEWKADFSFSTENLKYIPYFKYNKLGGWSLATVDYYCSGSVGEVAFYFKTESTAEYIANKFILIYNLHLNS